MRTNEQFDAMLKELRAIRKVLEAHAAADLDAEPKRAETAVRADAGVKAAAKPRSKGRR